MSVALPMPLDAGFAQWLRSHKGALAVAALLASAGPLTFFTGALSVMRQPALADGVRLGLWWTLYGASLWGLLLVIGYVCERGTRAVEWYTLAATWLLAAAAAAALPTLLAAGRAAILIDQGLVQNARTMHLHGFTVSFVMALLYFAHLRRSREHEEAAARLAAAQTAQRRARRRIVEARLQEVQARIDPEILFEMLHSVQRLYERDGARAERFLDEMIAFLRAALPRLRSPSSSLLREVELARAFVGLRALAGAGGGGMTVDVAPEALHARFPPGVLLPLLQGHGGSAPCRLAAKRSADGGRLVLTLEAAPSDRGVARVRSLLAELYASAAKVEIQGAATGGRVLVEVPYELA